MIFHTKFGPSDGKVKNFPRPVCIIVYEEYPYMRVWPRLAFICESRYKPRCDQTRDILLLGKCSTSKSLLGSKFLFSIRIFSALIHLDSI